MKLSEAEISAVLEAGNAARRLMANEDFLTIIDYLSTYHLQALVSAPVGPEGLAAREHHHTMHSALREIASELQGRAAAAEELAARVDADEEDIIE